jgi:aminoglycoside 3-N-acetyltransferase I
LTAGSSGRVQRLGPQDREVARTTFRLMAEVFETQPKLLSDAYLDALLGQPHFWAFAAMSGATVVGGLTAYTLMMTAFEGAEIFLYDIAVDPNYQRRGFGRRLVTALRREATALGISTIFVPADDEDTHALDFYSALGGTPSKVTFFEMGPG